MSPKNKDYTLTAITSSENLDSNISADSRLKEMLGCWVTDLYVGIGTLSIWIYQRGTFYLALNLHDFLHLATAYWQFRTPCIWSLTTLLESRLMSPFSCIHRTIIYICTCRSLSPKSELHKIVWPESTAVLDAPEGCVLVGPRNSRFFIVSNHILTISHANYLVSSKVGLN